MMTWWLNTRKEREKEEKKERGGRGRERTRERFNHNTQFCLVRTLHFILQKNEEGTLAVHKYCPGNNIVALTGVSQ